MSDTRTRFPAKDVATAGKFLDKSAESIANIVKVREDFRKALAPKVAILMATGNEAFQTEEDAYNFLGIADTSDANKVANVDSFAALKTMANSLTAAFSQIVEEAENGDYRKRHDVARKLFRIYALMGDFKTANLDAVHDKLFPVENV